MTRFHAASMFPWHVLMVHLCLTCFNFVVILSYTCCRAYVLFDPFSCCIYIPCLLCRCFFDMFSLCKYASCFHFASVCCFPFAFFDFWICFHVASRHVFTLHRCCLACVRVASLFVCCVFLLHLFVYHGFRFLFVFLRCFDFAFMFVLSFCMCCLTHFNFASFFF